MIASQEVRLFGEWHSATEDGEMHELDPGYQGEPEAPVEAPPFDSDDAVQNDALYYHAECDDKQRRMERIEELSRSQLADGPYDDILTPGDYPPELLKCQAFRAAAVTARKDGKRVMISPQDELSHARKARMADLFGKYRVEVVDSVYERAGGPSYRDIFNSLWDANFFTEGDFFRHLSSLHVGMNFDQLCEEALTTVMRLTIERVNRLAGVIRASYNADYSDYDIRMGMGRPSERRDAAQEELDRRIEVISRLLTHVKRPAKDKKHG